jgi:sec-independent protein translocase protein TatA
MKALGDTAVRPVATYTSPEISSSTEDHRMDPMLVGGLGTPELVIILVVVMLVFGGRKLPELGRGSGRALRIFKEEVNAPDDDADSSTTAPGDLEARQAAERDALQARHDAERRARDSE